VFVSFSYVLLWWLLELIALPVRSSEVKELEIVVLRHEVAILRRKTRRPAITVVDRLSPQTGPGEHRASRRTNLVSTCRRLPPRVSYKKWRQQPINDSIGGRSRTYWTTWAADGGF